MPSIIKMSNATIIAIHCMDYMSKNKKMASAKEMAKALNISYNHLSKVLQRLAGLNMVETSRGPAGGYSLTEKGRKSKIREIIYSIEGEKKYSNCLMEIKCDKKKCAFRSFLDAIMEGYNKILEKKLNEI